MFGDQICIEQGVTYVSNICKMCQSPVQHLSQNKHGFTCETCSLQTFGRYWIKLLTCMAH